MNIEFQILEILQKLHHPILDTFMVNITRLGDSGIVWILLMLLLLLIPKTRTIGIRMAIALIVFHISCNMVIKPLVARPRPYTSNPSVHLLVKALKDYSFPSGHTAASFACVFIFYKMHCRKLFWISLGLALLIAFSRLYLYVHFPTDVLAGMMLGILCGLVGYAAGNWIEKREEKWQIKE